MKKNGKVERVYPSPPDWFLNYTPPKDIDHFVRCEDRVFYTKDPLDTLAAPQETGVIKDFVVTRIYPMPVNAPNPTCWVNRCDLIWADFKKLNGLPFGSETQEILWATVKRWIPEAKCEPWVHEATLCREKRAGFGYEKTLSYWREETYELRGIGYNGNPPNPWESVVLKSS